MLSHQDAFIALRKSLESYAVISDDTWNELKQFCHYRELDKLSFLYKMGDVPNSFSYVYQGLFRCFICDDKGNEYNKIFFCEGMFPGSMTSLLTSSPSFLAIEAIEKSQIIEIEFAAFRQLLLEKEDLKLFQIAYLEKNWLLEKERREIEIVQENATSRYLRFLAEYPELESRIPQYHIASHLGITPTQLSRIRKKL
ncbi:Crp/Fnr family transcriptional regulator [Marinomonas sp. C2222]|uniref:Crp/Fnr family transcriptional regulator n=1 Tax=Marinomonas sargassi TaxID=2984494 RepID=A0ABT2YU76_9GAMM|nr:Crp/Fnr family transcriptional regulator [Marinomonas sargassi]MCV2403437.1 Crp/Fnr family transcriptional regulator [Marinomonas sargassi]